MSAAVMALGHLVERARQRGLAAEARGGACAGVVVEGISNDSRKVGPGHVFVAMAGTREDGGKYIDAALAAGAVAVVCTAQNARRDALCIVVDDPHWAAGVLASAFYGDPSEAMDVVAVTGTNGKTSCTYLLESVWKTAGRSPGVIGTIVQRCSSFERVADMTTPSAIDLQKTLADMLAAGCDAVAMEASSHALDQRRIAGCRIRTGVFTNLTRDHLDYHQTEESYFAAKASLFRRHLQQGSAAVLNVEDARVASLAQELTEQRPDIDVWTYSTERGAASRARVLEAECTLVGIRARLEVDGETVVVRSPLVGAANLSNIVAVAAAGCALGIDAEVVGQGLSACPPVPGRMQRISPRPPAVLVDYAHTPDALERSIRALLPETSGRLIVVFGCGGDRDRGKRPIMGGIAGELADVAVLTSDNPRTERPEDILADIESGVGTRLARTTASELAEPDARGYVVEADRRTAIEAAIALAADEDVVLVAGKGHEDYQEVHGVKRHFDDREVASAALARRSGN
ncbi:MAG TPA: UDP-N-acetylmuramoyl-L-alanyl-D-glutamate--2,6-diaminopimelate ligase [Candidatus Limnocylindrales bacterium]|nr:UDP-N-acetylmuramoyl-L-alanyl-D-glutamate--2,6-diaminopimelate ligase [Candidatus Limnocylindrales bacterium]